MVCMTQVMRIFTKIFNGALIVQVPNDLFGGTGKFVRMTFPILCLVGVLFSYSTGNLRK